MQTSWVNHCCYFTRSLSYFIHLS